jgi:hypothetical protein
MHPNNPIVAVIATLPWLIWALIVSILMIMKR